MEALLAQVEQLSSLLAASRSGLVGGWDPATLERALRWGRFFQRLHRRLHSQPALKRCLRRGGSQLGLGYLRRCPQLLGLALLKNRALPSAARQRLLRCLLRPPARAREEEEEEEEPEPFSVHLLARRRAASQLLQLAPPPEASAAEQWQAPPVRAQAQLLLWRLREEDGEGGKRGLLEQLPGGPALYRAVAAALLEPTCEAEARAALVPWLLQGDPARQAAFYRLLPGPWAASLCSRHPELLSAYSSLLSAWGSRLSYDPLLGEWKDSGLGGAELTWQELRKRVGCLCEESGPLRSAMRTQLRRLKAQDGDFEVRGLSVWTDLLLDLETSASWNEAGRYHLPRLPLTKV